MTYKSGAGQATFQEDSVSKVRNIKLFRVFRSEYSITIIGRALLQVNLDD
jgi:hypothetical protein